MNEDHKSTINHKSRQFTATPFLLDRLCDEEEGSSMIFGVLTMLGIATTIALVFNTGMATVWSQESQNAADAAAYSGALVAANNMNAIAQMNDAMSVVYYSMMRYSIDAITFGVLNNIAQHPDHVRSNPGRAQVEPSWLAEVNPTFATPDRLNPAPVRVYGHYYSMNQFRQQYGKQNDGYVARAIRMIDRGEKWIKALALAERALAKATPKMIENAVHEIVRSNFSRNASPNGALRDDEVYVSIVPEMTEELFFGNDQQSLLKPDENSSDLFDEDFYQRYEYRHPLNDFGRTLEGGPVPVPSQWYSAAEGKSTPTEGFVQYRVCWNFHDYVHSGKLNAPLDKGIDHSASKFGKYSDFKNNAPNGHWHKKHEHKTIVWKETFFGRIPWPGDKTHYSGHGEKNLFSALSGNPDPADFVPIGNYSEEPPVAFPLAPGIHLTDGGHHEIEECPTCQGKHYPILDAEVSVVKVTERRPPGNPMSAVGGSAESGPFTVDQRYRELQTRFSNTKDVQPLVLNRSIANFGINVAVAVIPHKDKVFIPSLFTNPGYGYVSVASAKIGLVQKLSDSLPQIDLAGSGNGSTWAANISSIRDEPSNLYLQNGEAEQQYSDNVDSSKFKTTYFCGRLTPLRLNSWGSDGGGGAISFEDGLQELLLGGKWRQAGNPNGGYVAKVSDALREKLSVDGSTKDVLHH